MSETIAAISTAFGEAAVAPTVNYLGTHGYLSSDPELDGIQNLVEYALLLDPLVASQSQLPTAVMDAATIQLTWRKNKAATDITIRVQTSSDLAAWITETPANSILSDDGSVQVIRSTVPRTGNRQYIRLDVLPPP